MRHFEGRCGNSLRPLVHVRIRAARDNWLPRSLQHREIEGLAMLDTGSDVSGLSQQAVDDLGLGYGPPVEITIRGVTGKPEKRIAFSFSASLVANTSSLGVQTISGSITAAVPKFEQEGNMSGLPVIALFGMDVLSRCTVYLDGPASRLVFSVENLPLAPVA